MFCNKCGKQKFGNETVCTNCGNPLTNSNSPNGVIAPTKVNTSANNNQQVPQPNQQYQNYNQPGYQNNNQGYINSVPQNNQQIPNPQMMNTNMYNQQMPNQPMYKQPIPQKKKKKKPGCLIFFIILILLIVGIVFLVSKFITPAETTKESITFAKDYKYLANYANGETIINNAAEDITFYVTPDTTYTLVDSKGIPVQAELKDNQIVSSTNYTPGETYTLTLTTGKFVSSQLADVKKVNFNIKKLESKNYKFNSNIKNVKKSDLTISSDKKSFVSQTTYLVGDVIVISDDTSISEAYVVTAKEDTTYQIREATLKEIYSELNYYTESYVDLSNYEVASEIKSYISANVRESSWYQALVKEVRAEPKIEVEISKIENGLEAKTTITIEAGDSSVFINSQYHDFEIVFTQSIMVSQLVDVTLDDWNVSLDVTSDQDFEFHVKNDILDYDKTIGNKKVDVDLLEKVKNALENNSYKDTNNKSTSLAQILIPTGVPCLNVELELKLANEFTGSIDLGVKVGQTTNIVAGFDYGVGEEFKFIGSYDKDYDGLEFSFAGKVEDKLGLELTIGLDLINTVDAGISIETGAYAEAGVTITGNISTDAAVNIKANYDAGLYLDFGITAEAAGVEFKHDFVSEKWSLKSDEIEYTYPDSTTTDEATTKSNGITVTSEKNRLENYSCVSSLDEDSYTKNKFIYENGTFKGVDVTGVYYINTGIEWVDNLLKLLCKIIGLYSAITLKVPVEFYEEGYNFYLIFHLDQEAWAKENGTSIEETDYNSFKVSMVEDGYTCK